MSDLFNRITDDQDIIRKLFSKIPGFNGYVERENRRAADKILREAIADRFEELWQRVSSLQNDLISSGGLEYIDDLERAAIKIRQFIDRIRHASYGYSPFFNATKVNEEELTRVYEYDLALLENVDVVSRAIDNIESSIGTDGLPAAIRHLTNLSQQTLDVYNRRSEVLMGGIDTDESSQ
jgi:hypothetical protein